MANGDGRPVVLTALGSGEKLFALVPLAVLSVASVAGLAATGNGDPANSASPADSGMAVDAPGHETARRQVPSQGTSPSARPTFSETAAPVVEDESTGSPMVHEETASTAEPTTPSSPVESRAEPADRPDAAEPTAPAPTASPTATPEPADSDSLSRVEATALCLESGISTVDVLALTACVEELLG